VDLAATGKMSRSPQNKDAIGKDGAKASKDSLQSESLDMSDSCRHIKVDNKLSDEGFFKEY